jgi:outer membrane protein assembly factor BamB
LKVKIVLFLPLIILSICLFPIFCQDWPQWRGPDRNGVAPEKELPENWAKEVPRKIWQSDRIPGGKWAGYSSPCVADGKVFVFVNWLATDRILAKDTIYCLDEKTGKTIWKKEFPGVWEGSGKATSSTPCIADGRCYVVGSDEIVFCLDIKDGKEIWKSKGGSSNSSVLVVDNTAVVTGASAFNAETGKLLWNIPKAGGDASPVYWKKDGKTYIILKNKKNTLCIELKTGKVLWKLPEFGYSTPVVYKDFLIIACHNRRMAAYRLSIEKPKKIWVVPGAGGGYCAASPVVYNKRAYVFGPKGNAVCVDIASGKTMWKQKIEGAVCSSPILVQGNIIHAGQIFSISDKECTVLARGLNQLTCSSPAFANGRLFLRTFGGISCYAFSGNPERYKHLRGKQKTKVRGPGEPPVRPYIH